jgi:hypothetical protein
MGEHPEDEEDLYEEEIEVRFSIALGASSVIGRFSGLRVLWVGLLRLRPEDVGGVPKGRKTWSVRHTFKRFLLVLGSGGARL